MREVVAAGVSATGVMLLTALHHAYGAVRFATPWRHHVAGVSLLVILGITLTLGLHLMRAGRTGRITLLVACALIFVVPVAWIGGYEGGYNHVLKIALYYAGLPAGVFNRLYPPPTYEPPSDWLFELTGVLQLPAGLLAGYLALGLWRARSRLPMGRF